jgi:ABC-2 type transport system ATP-binding protein
MLYEQDVPRPAASQPGAGFGDVAIDVAEVTKRFGAISALDGVSFQADSGAVTALLGPNGAGKTTMIRILSTLLRPDAGTVCVGGYDTTREPEQVQAIIGLTGQSLSVDGRLSGPENLAMFGRLHRMPWPLVHDRSARLVATFGLADAGARPVKTYSGGMRRKLDLAVSLMAEPPVLFLDEPTTGLDPASRDALWDIIRDRVRAGTTVLLTTQHLDEADALADAVVFIDGGHVVATGTPAELKARTGRSQIDLIAASDADLGRLIPALAAFRMTSDAPRRTVRVAIDHEGTTGLRELSDVMAAVVQAEACVERFALHEPSLDDVYRRLTGRTVHVVSAEGPA